MPKLDTTIDNLEWKSNKIISTSAIPASDWTDAHYPSAKTLLNIAHPIGSILTTATNTNPSATLGGTWELVDKSLKPAIIALTPSIFNAGLSTLDATASSVMLADHTVNIILTFYTSASYVLSSAAVNLGKFVLSSFGLKSIPVIDFKGLATTKDANETIEYTFRFSADGTVSTQKVLNTTSEKFPVKFYVQLTIPVGFDNMLTGNDTFFDKFYWERTT